MAKKIKLTKAQKRTIEIMRTGYDAAICRGLNTFQFLQYGKISHGGKTEKVRYIVLEQLISKGMISDNGTSVKQSDTHYSLTELGKTITLPE